MYPIALRFRLPAFWSGILDRLAVPHSETFSLRTYGLLMTLGFCAAAALIFGLAKRRGCDRDAVADLLLGVLVSGVIGARMLFVIVRWDLYRGDIPRIFNLREGGLVFQGGLIGALLFGYGFTRLWRMSFWESADLIAPGLALGHAFGRLGCFAAGCCYGRPSTLPWALAFRDPFAAGPPLGVPLHPVQLYEAGADFILTAVLLRRWPRRAFAGEVILGYVLAYSALRFGIECFRGDVLRGSVGILGTSWRLSTSQVLGAIEFVAASMGYRLLRRR